MLKQQKKKKKKERNENRALLENQLAQNIKETNNLKKRKVGL